MITVDEPGVTLGFLLRFGPAHRPPSLGLSLLLFDCFFHNGFLQLGSLPLLERFSAFQDSLDYLTSIYVLEVVPLYFLEDTHLLRGCVWVICKGNERSWPMINGAGHSRRHRL